MDENNVREKYIKNLNKGYTFSKDGFDVNIPSIDNNEISICFVDVKGERTTYCMLDKSTMFYYIIDGNGEFEIDSDKIKVAKNDLIEILPKQKYSYKGNMKMLEIQSNQFDENEIHELEKQRKDKGIQVRYDKETLWMIWEKYR